MSKKLSSLFLLAILAIQFIIAQEVDSSERIFDRSRTLLAQRQIDEALEQLRILHKAQPNNANVNFLMGAAYTEKSRSFDKAIYHLKKAIQKVSRDYEVGSFKEERAPIHSYYYLTLALVESDQCAEAYASLQELKEYSDLIDSYFIEEADRHLQKCPFKKEEENEDWKQEVNVPEGYDPIKVVYKKPEQTDSARVKNRGLVTKKLKYTTSAPLYGVQIASNTNPIPISRYNNMKNVDIFVDNAGMIRYVIGHFPYRKQAESLLESLQKKGYEDAFIVNVNDERKYSNEVVSYQNVNLRSGLNGKVEYYIQLGAFKDTVPSALMDVYHTIDGITELKYNDMTIMAVGAYSTYAVALQKQDEINSLGLSDAFIVAFNKGTKISLEEAINYTDQ
jgi:tetratricopeptide (TPR) repeat protein